jgi:Zn ribbon nucleic-acid-binding protein
MHTEIAITIYCPDCRGKFDVETDDIIEDDLIECVLCGAEMKVLSEDPIRLKLLVDGNDDY